MEFRNRFWQEFYNSIYYYELLTLNIDNLKERNKYYEIFSTFFTVLNVGGWLKYAEYANFFAFIITLFTAFRLAKPHVSYFKSETEISALQAIANFYADGIRAFENTWYDWEENKISDEQARMFFSKYYEEERIAIKINKHIKIDKNNKFHSIAEETAEKYLSKFKNLN